MRKKIDVYIYAVISALNIMLFCLFVCLNCRVITLKFVIVQTLFRQAVYMSFTINFVIVRQWLFLTEYRLCFESGHMLMLK